MLRIKNLPFYWRFEKNLICKDEIPALYDFIFEIDNELKLIIEKKDPTLINILNNVYKENSNIGYMIDGHNLSNHYGTDYLNFLTSIVGNFAQKKIIDVGCGGCTLLDKLAQENAIVIGVDPSPIAKIAAKNKSIPLINDFYKSGTLANHDADLITQMDVFEHVYDPLSILKAESQSLSHDGIIAINVPDCEFSIKNGDISLAIHQHVNMFTRYSICKLVENAGLHVSELKLSDYGAAIFCAASKNKKMLKFHSNDFKEQIKWSEEFFLKAVKRIEKFKSFLKKIDDFRFFDNNILWHNNYLDGIPKKIENFDDLIKNPPNKLIIMSNTFGKDIKDQVNSILKNKIDIFLQDDIF